MEVKQFLYVLQREAVAIPEIRNTSSYFLGSWRAFLEEGQALSGTQSEICSSVLKEGGLLSEVSKHHVAQMAEKTSNPARVVVMVNLHPGATCSQGRRTDKALTTLPTKHSISVFRGETVFLEVAFLVISSELVWVPKLP